MDLTQPFQLIVFSITLITLLLQAFVLFLIAFVSPKSMSDYRRYLIVNTVFEMLYAFDFGLVLMNEPPEFFPGAGTFVRGFAAYFGETVIRVSSALLYFIAAFMVGSQDICLIYRFLAVHPNRDLAKKFTKLSCTLFVYGLVFVISVLIGLAAFLVIAPSSEHKTIIESWMMKTSGKLPEYIDLETPRLLLYNNKPFITYFFNGIGICLGISEIVYLVVVFKILRVLRKSSSSFSKRSIKLQRQLALLLGAQVIVPILLAIAPFSVLLYRMKTHSMNTKFETEMGMILFMSHLTVLSLMTIFFVTPYRKFVIDKFKRLISRDRSMTTIIAITSSSNY